MDPKWPVYIKEVQITQPAATWLVPDEDPQSINDATFLVDVGGSGRLLDLPSRLHGNGCGINFNDGHAEIYRFCVISAERSWNFPAPIVPKLCPYAVGQRSARVPTWKMQMQPIHQPC